MGTKIPLYGSHVEATGGTVSKGLVIKSSDCPKGVPSIDVSKLHRNLQKRIDRRKVPNDEQVGWIKVNENAIVDWDINDNLL